ncbi:hypothetical protein COY52_04675 [Candidatus Desantisbacteria bacterium CG_4_10_14_0_8_um_filter_48_22]|uniref:Uncharacterized protein n=1 Tax=Candidatus Desantisbacteria bacterium CG_4_10_14_0_8_um_filter_48_22 TaxID=1974543 RepID=A0A2M7SCU0_9BACT|nr:MAG: hypothetical protein COY52_04675 [Candidatus Desantisbacteria bacterium CG_4_10_14_0_8_um_filter_48_22]
MPSSLMAFSININLFLEFDGAILPADVMLINSLHPETNNSSATSTTKGAPTTQPIMPNFEPLYSKLYNSVW